MIALIHGPDAALARAEVARLLREHDPEGSNTSRLDGREVSLAEVIAAIGTVGFFGGRRAVVVRDLMARASRASGRQADSEPDAGPPTGRGGAALDLAPLFAAVPADNLLVLVDPELTAIPAAVRRAAPPDALIFAGEPPRGAALTAWLSKTVHELGGELDRTTAKLLAETLYPQTWASKPANPRYDRPPDLELLRNELERLVLAAHPGPVTAPHIRTLVDRTPDDRVFRFVEAAASGQLGVAVRELEQLLLAGEEPAKLSAQLDQQVELAVVAAAAPTLPPTEVGRALGLSNPNRMTGIAASRRNAVAPAGTAVVAAAERDRQLKRGRLRQPEDALYGLLTDLAGDRANSKGGGI